jgi:hypothetical protein
VKYSWVNDNKPAFNLIMNMILICSFRLQVLELPKFQRIYQLSLYYLQKPHAAFTEYIILYYRYSLNKFNRINCLFLQHPKVLELLHSDPPSNELIQLNLYVHMILCKVCFTCNIIFACMCMYPKCCVILMPSHNSQFNTSYCLFTACYASFFSSSFSILIALTACK